MRTESIQRAASRLRSERGTRGVAQVAMRRRCHLRDLIPLSVLLAAGVVPGSSAADPPLIASLTTIVKPSPFLYTLDGSAGGRAVQPQYYGYAVAMGDFDGDGIDDIAIGDPEADILSPAVVAAGTVLVGSSMLGSTALWSQDNVGVAGTAEGSDYFGQALAVGDFDGDGFDDVAIGVPGEDIGAVSNAGAVNVLYGTASGLSAAGNQLWSQDSSVGGDTVLGVSEANDDFGWAVAAGDFDNDGYDDLAIGVPGQDLTGGSEAGMLNVLYGSASGLTPVNDQTFSQGFAGLLDAEEPDDRFGEALATGDFDGDGYDDLAVGVPFEDVGAYTDAGAFHVIYGSSSGLTTAGNTFWHLDSPGVIGVPQPQMRFGFALAAGDFQGDSRDDLAIGRPRTNEGAILDAGAVQVMHGSATGVTADGDLVFSQAFATTLDDAEAYDQFGFALAAGDFDLDGYDDMAVGVPGEDGYGGAVQVFYGSSTSVNADRDQLFSQTDPDVPDTGFGGEFLGYALASGDLDGNGSDDLAAGVPSNYDPYGLADNPGAVNLFRGGAFCGNTFVDPGEECDDGNNASGDGCTDLCALEYCGDGVLQTGLGEACDDGNAVPEDGCSDLCAVEVCGDGVVQAGLGEACDDGGVDPLDGCSDVCAVENGIEVLGDDEGGEVFFTVEGVGLSITTTGALTTDQIAQIIALEINNDSTLTVLGISAQAVGSQVFTDGVLTDVSTSDPGLILTNLPPEAPPPLVPAIDPLGVMLLAVMLGTAGLLALGGRRASEKATLLPRRS